MLSTFSLVVGGIILLVFAIWKYLGRNQDYWVKRGFKVLQIEGGRVKGMFHMLSGKKSFMDFDHEYYHQIKDEDKFGGIVDFGVPTLIIKDTNLIKQVLVKDFDSFVDRRKMKLDSEPLFNLMLSVLEGQEWKNMRSIMSPTFTTGKIRRMFENFNSCGAQLAEFITSKPVGSPGTRDVVVKEAISRYLVDVIGATAFGMETNSLRETNSMFYKMAKRTSEFSTLKLIRIFLTIALPFLTKLGIRFSDAQAMDFFEGILRSALKNRENTTEKREDFLQMMIEQRRGELKTDESELDTFEKEAQLNNTGKSKVVLTDDLILAQSLLFFIAGLDTTGSVLNLAAYLLALHPDIQEKLHEEVSKVMTPNKGQVDYEGINHMEYMEKFISEILRKYPPGTRLERRCKKDYKIPDTDMMLEKDTIVTIPVLAIHHDPALYPDPEKFDPERFAPEAKAARNPYTYLPGHGPRNCIGMRFALMEAKVAIAYLVYNFSIEPCEKTPVPLKLDPTMPIRPVLDLELRFKERLNNKTEE